MRWLKVLENPWKVLEFKSCKFWNFAFIITVLVSIVQYTSLSYCSLNFECPRLGYGFLSIILVLEKCNLGPWKVLEFCTLSLLRTLNVLGSSQGAGQFLGISPGWLWSKGNIRHESKSFGRWQQRCCLSLSILQLLLLHPFNGLFYSTTSISRLQKGKTSLDLNEARSDGVLGCSGISWTICKQSAPLSRQITTPTSHRSIFIGRMLFLMPSQQFLSTEGTADTHLGISFWNMQPKLATSGKFCIC